MNRFSYVLVSILLVSAFGCGHAGPSADFSGYFLKMPYLNPTIIQDLSCWESDAGDQVVAINVTQSQDSNRYSVEIQQRVINGENPYIYLQKKEQDENLEFGYQYIGRLENGVYVLKTASASGGSGVFENLMLVNFTKDNGLKTDWYGKTIGNGPERLLIVKKGEIILGDRWNGSLKIHGNNIEIGVDKEENDITIDGRKSDETYDMLVEFSK